MARHRTAEEKRELAERARELRAAGRSRREIQAELGIGDDLTTPKMVRKNVDDAYVGCLVIRLRQCRTLYQQIEGVWQGIMGGLPEGSEDELSRVV